MANDQPNGQNQLNQVNFSVVDEAQFRLNNAAIQNIQTQVLNYLERARLQNEISFRRGHLVQQVQASRSAEQQLIALQDAEQRIADGLPYNPAIVNAVIGAVAAPAGASIAAISGGSSVYPSRQGISQSQSSLATQQQRQQQQQQQQQQHQQQQYASGHTAARYNVSQVQPTASSSRTFPVVTPDTQSSSVASNQINQQHQAARQPQAAPHDDFLAQRLAQGTHTDHPNGLSKQQLQSTQTNGPMSFYHASSSLVGALGGPEMSCFTEVGPSRPSSAPRTGTPRIVEISDAQSDTKSSQAKTKEVPMPATPNDSKAQTIKYAKAMATRYINALETHLTSSTPGPSNPPAETPALSKPSAGSSNPSIPIASTQKPLVELTRPLSASAGVRGVSSALPNEPLQPPLASASRPAVTSTTGPVPKVPNALQANRPSQIQLDPSRISSPAIRPNVAQEAPSRPQSAGNGWRTNLDATKQIPPAPMSAKAPPVVNSNAGAGASSQAWQIYGNMYQAANVQGAQQPYYQHNQQYQQYSAYPAQQLAQARGQAQPQHYRAFPNAEAQSQHYRTFSVSVAPPATVSIPSAPPAPPSASFSARTTKPRTPKDADRQKLAKDIIRALRPDAVIPRPPLLPPKRKRSGSEGVSSDVPSKRARSAEKEEEEESADEVERGLMSTVTAENNGVASTPARSLRDSSAGPPGIARDELPLFLPSTPSGSPSRHAMTTAPKNRAYVLVPRPVWFNALQEREKQRQRKKQSSEIHTSASAAGPASGMGVTPY